MIRNVYQRYIAAYPAEVGALLDSVGTPEDRLWPAPPRDAMVLRHPDGPSLRVGARGGHGPIRYRVEAHDPGRRVLFRLAGGAGLDGWHALTVEPAAGGSLLRHELQVRPRGLARLVVPVVLSMHDCYVEDAFDRAERELGVGPVREHRHSLPVRVFERRLRRRVTPTEPVLDGLGAGALPRIDAADAFRTDLIPGDGSDPAAWTAAVLSSMPSWVGALMRVRDALMRRLGVRTADELPGATLPMADRSTTEVVVGLDDKHLDFRLVTTVDEAARSVTLTTVVHLHSPLGRAYWSVVRFFHPVVLRALLRGTAHPAGVSELQQVPVREW